MSVAQYKSIDDLPPEERLISCPYNKAHKVVSKRMANHLLKCRLSHSTAGTATCRFNSTHVIPLQEKELHELDCPERQMIDAFLLEKKNRMEEVKEEDSAIGEESYMSSEWETVSGSAYEPDSGNVSMNTTEIQVDEGDWDDDLPSRTYVPLQILDKRKKKDGVIIRTHIQHGLPSERRRLREELRIGNQKILENAMKKEEAKETATNQDYVAENHRRSKTRIRQNYSRANRPSNSAYHLH